jgi:hypothetical protein
MKRRFEVESGMRCGQVDQEEMPEHLQEPSTYEVMEHVLIESRIIYTDRGIATFSVLTTVIVRCRVNVTLKAKPVVTVRCT